MLTKCIIEPARQWNIGFHILSLSIFSYSRSKNWPRRTKNGRRRVNQLLSERGSKKVAYEYFLRFKQGCITLVETQQSYCQSWSLRRATSRKENFDCIFFLHKNIDEAIFRCFTLLIESSVAEWRAHRTPQQFGGPRLDSPARTVRLHGQICFSAVLSPFNLSL